MLYMATLLVAYNVHTVYSILMSKALKFCPQNIFVVNKILLATLKDENNLPRKIFHTKKILW